MLFPLAWSCDGHELLAAEQRGYSTAPFHALLIDPRTRALIRVPSGLDNVWGLSCDGRDVLAERDGNVVSVTQDGRARILARGARHPTWTK